jgi:hypothetical protein
MQKWVLLYAGKQPPVLAPDQWICLAMADGKKLWVKYRFVKNITGHILAYSISGDQNH